MKITLSRTWKVGNGCGRIGVRASAAECVDDCDRDLDLVPVLIPAPYHVVIHVRILVWVPVCGFGHNHALA